MYAKYPHKSYNYSQKIINGELININESCYIPHDLQY